MKLLITSFAIAALVCTLVLSLPAFAQSTTLQNFDKDACYAKCACAWGMFTACASCKAACDRAFWRAWSKEVDENTDLEKGNKRSRRTR